MSVVDRTPDGGRNATVTRSGMLRSPGGFAANSLPNGGRCAVTSFGICLFAGPGQLANSGKSTARSIAPLNPCQPPGAVVPVVLSTHSCIGSVWSTATDAHEDRVEKEARERDASLTSQSAKNTAVISVCSKPNSANRK